MNLVRIVQAFIFLITLGVGLAALFIWQPGGRLSKVDDVLSPIKNESFSIGAKIEDNTPEGSRDRIIREVAPPSHSALDYVVCEIDDDPEQVNAFGIYHPADIAITLSNLRQQGVQRVYLSTHLHWPELDLEENNTLSTALKPFQSAVVSAPLRRNLSADHITPAFIRASIPASEVRGGLELLPVVNSIGIEPDVIFPGNTYAGFSSLESEKSSDSVPLVARWGDRVVFSATLLGLMQNSKVTPDQLIVQPGDYIRIGNTGNIIPIDTFGHFKPDPLFTAKTPPRTITSALSGESSIIGATQKAAIITATGTNSSKFEAVGSPYEKLSILAYSPRVSGAKTLSRIPTWLECILIVDIAILSAWLLAYKSLRRNISFLLTQVAIWVVFLIIYHILSYWSPVAVYSLTLLTGWTLSIVLAKPVRRSLS